MIRNKRLLLWMVWLAGSPLLAEAQSKPMDSIAFFLKEDNRIYTHCQVNHSDTLLFLIDTGASDMVLNTNSPRKMDVTYNTTTVNTGTTGQSEVRASSGNQFLWGHQKKKDVSFIGIAYANERWDGVLGLSVLRQYVVRIDYDRMFIYLYDQAGYRNDQQQKLKMTYAHQVPMIEVEIETIDQRKRKVKVEVDTGSDRIFDLSTSYVNTQKLLEVYRSAFATSTITSSDGGKGIIYNVFFPKVNFSNYQLYRIPGGVAQIQFGVMNTVGFDGMIGNSLLKRFNLTLDFKNDELTMEPNNNMYTPFYDFLLRKE